MAQQKTVSAAFRDSVEGYLLSSNMDPTKFGALAMNDPSFVGRLRKGRAHRVTTVDRVLAWINKNPPGKRVA